MPAARVGDMTSHGMPLGPGPGSAAVLIGGHPAARQHDVVVEAQGANPIVTGALGVLIG